jgi:hypothetical protein
VADSITIPAPAGWPAGITVETDGSLLDGLSGAALSPDRAYRYVLTRTWGDAPAMTWVMLNPSTADAKTDDPTIRRCVRFARREGCGGIAVVNLFGLRATDPRALRDSLEAGIDPVGPVNDWFVRMHTQGASRVVAAWGTHGTLRGRAAEVARMLEVIPGIRLECLGVTKDGHPKHPLARGRERVPDDAPLVPWQVPS